MLFLLFFLVLAEFGNSQIINNWRGPNRDGKYHETNLLKLWPENGPAVLWTFEEIGLGFSSPVIHNGRIYVTGMEGEAGFIYVLSMQGKLLKKFPYGNEMAGSFPGSRTTPTLAGDLLYMVSGLGRLVCMNINTGAIVWSKDLFGDFDGQNIRWGFTENMIIYGNNIFVSPGGARNNVVALNRLNGNLVWTSPGKGSLSSYCSPLIVNHNGRNMLVTMMQDYIIGLDLATGRLLWSHPYANERNIHPNTPVYYDGALYCFSGYGKGGLKLKLNQAGTVVTQEWFNALLDNQIGGTVHLNGYIYGSGDRNRRWFTLD